MASFEVKDFELLKASLLNYMSYSDNSLTDFNVGAVFRCMLEAVAQEEEEIYFRLWQGVQKAIQESILYSFNFVPTKGTFASGIVTFGRDNPAVKTISIPAGTSVATSSGALFKTVIDTYIMQGQTSVSVNVVASTYGSASNLITVNSLLQMVKPIHGVSWAKNTTALAGGSDTESQASLFARFTQYIDSLSRGTLYAIRYGATLAQLTDGDVNITERVVRAKAVDYATNLGYVDCFVDNGAGNTSTTLVALAQKIIDGYITEDGTMVEGYKAAGCRVLVSPAVAVVIHIDVLLAAQDFYEAKPYVEGVIQYYFSNLNIGQTVNYERLVAECMFAFSGIIDVVVENPSADIHINANEICILGDLTITAARAIDGNIS